MMQLAVDQTHCELFSFVIDSIVTGLLCMIGFAGNSVAFVALWREQQSLPTVLFLQAILISDTVVLSMIFLADSVPSLSFAVSLLHNCSSTCEHVLTIARPILLLGQLCTVWFTVLLAISHCMALSSPAHAPKLSAASSVRIQIILCATCAVLFTMPRTFDAAMTVTWLTQDGTERTSSLADQPTYKMIYANLMTLCALYVIPLLLLFCISVRLTLMMSRRRLHRQQLVDRITPSSDRHSLQRPPAAGGQCASHYYPDDRALTDIVLMLSLCLFICYLPTCILNSFSVAMGDLTETCGEVQFYARSFTQLIIVINSSIKILLLLLFVPRFRYAVRRLCCCSASQDSRHLGDDVTNSRTSSATQHRFTSYRCADTSEMTLMSSAGSGQGTTPSYMDDVTFWE